MMPFDTLKRVWAKLEKNMLHPGLYENPVEIRRARLMLGTCLLAGTAFLGIIIFALTEQPELLIPNLLIGIGHLAVCSTVFLLRRYPTVSKPATIITIILVSQLFSATYWSGGHDSPTLYVYPLATVFLGLLGGMRHGLWSAVFLSLAAGVIWVIGDATPDFPPLPPSVEVLNLVCAILTGGGIVYYFQVQTDQLLGLARQRVDELTKARKEAEEANQAKDLFMAYLSHEIRNPLAIIIGAIELMAMKGAEHRREAHLGKLQSASQGLTSLLQDVLDYASLERGQLKVQTSTIAVSEMLSQLHEDFAEAAHEKGLDFALEMPVEKLTVQGDPGRLRQVLTNLTENAIKFTDKGGVKLRVVSDGSEARIQIEDTGPGIPETQQAHIFQPFIRGQQGNGEGVGLGLAISSGLIEKMGSHLVLDSRPGSATIFSFTLPVIEGEETETALAAPAVETHPLAIPRVLVVDDNHEAAQLLAEMCKALGCDEVRVCHDGSDAIDTVNIWQPNVIFLDLEMPRINGREVAQAIHQEHTEPAPRVVLVTGSVVEDDIGSDDLPVATILPKPVRAAELRNVLTHP